MKVAENTKALCLALWEPFCFFDQRPRSNWMGTVDRVGCHSSAWKAHEGWSLENFS